MKKILYISFFAAITFVMSQISQSFDYAWWVGIIYEPEATHIQSIPVSEIDPKWTLAETLSKKAIPPQEVNNFEKYHETYGYSFSKEGDYNADGKRDRAFVGIYKDKSNEVGRFLLILTESNKNNWVKSFLYKSPGKSGFSILTQENNQLAWHFCMECDILSFVRWEKGHMLSSRSIPNWRQRGQPLILDIVKASS